MALKNIKNHGCGAVARDGGILTTDQIQIVTRAAVPTDSTLANGRLVYVTGTGFRGYAEGAWFTIPTSTSGGSAGSWDTIYTSDQTLTVDGSSMTFAGSHATNDVITISGSGSGDLLQFSNTGSGSDIKGTSNTWAVSAAGALTCITIADSATNGTLNIDGNGSGGVMIGHTSTGAISLDRATTVTVGAFTVTGAAGSDYVVVTAGDVNISDGSLTIADDDVAATVTITNTGTVTTGIGVVTIVADAATTGNVIDVNADAITSGTLLHLDTTAATFTGNYIDCYDGAASDFTVGLYGATVIAGNAATNVLTITAGHEVITSGNLTLTAGNLVMTNGSFTYTAGDMTMSDGSITVTDADNAATLSVTNNTATTASVFVFAGSGTYTGSTTTSFMTITPSGLTSGTAVYLPLALMAGGVGLDMPLAALTTGAGIRIVQTGEVIAAGELLTLTNTESGTTVVAKTGSLVSISSSQTEAGTSTQDFDLLGLTRTSIHTTAGTLTATGSVLKVSNVATQTTATLTDTVKGIEVVMDADGTGAGVDITHAATGGVALNIVGAATSVSDVLITGSGVKATGKGTLEVTNSGATAAGGAVLKVGYTGTPAAATSYLANFDYTGGTNSTSIAVIVQSEGTGTPLLVTTSGAAADGVLQLVSTETGTTGVVVKTVHTSTGSAAANDIVCSFQMWGLDSGDAVEEYGRIEAKALTVTGGAEASAMQFYVTVNGTSETSLVLKTDYAIVGAGTANAYVTSSGAYDLILNTNEGTSSGTITIADAANGDITIAPNGTGNTVIYAPTWIVTNKTTTATLTVAEGGVITCDTTAGAFTITLPAVSGTSGLWYTFKKTDSNANAITIDTPGSETIDGAAQHTTMDAQYDTITIVSNGSNWFIVSQKIA